MNCAVSVIVCGVVAEIVYPDALNVSNDVETSAPRLTAYAPSAPLKSDEFSGAVALVCVHGTSMVALFHTLLLRSHVPLPGSIVEPLVVFPASQVSVAASTGAPIKNNAAVNKA